MKVIFGRKNLEVQIPSRVNDHAAFLPKGNSEIFR